MDDEQHELDERLRELKSSEATREPLTKGTFVKIVALTVVLPILMLIVGWGLL